MPSSAVPAARFRLATATTSHIGTPGGPPRHRQTARLGPLLKALRGGAEHVDGKTRTAGHRPSSNSSCSAAWPARRCSRPRTHPTPRGAEHVIDQWTREQFIGRNKIRNLLCDFADVTTRRPVHSPSADCQTCRIGDDAGFKIQFRAIGVSGAHHRVLAGCAWRNRAGFPRFDSDPKSL